MTLADRDGIDALSMRKLGKELGVEAMTLYYYVPNKDAVLDGLVELVVARVDVRTEGPWREWARNYALSFRRELLAHPALLPVVAVRPVATPGGLATVERAASALVAEGFTPAGALHVITSVSTFVVGQTLAEVPSGPSSPDFSAYPTLVAAVAAGLGTPEDHLDRFEYALDALLTGLSPR